jgi:hypothetical protein
MKKKLILILVMIAGVAFAANEIGTIITFTVTKGNLNVQKAVNLSFTLTASDPQVAGTTQIITSNAVATAITLGNVTTNGWSYFRNLSTSAAYYVELGYSPDAGTSFYPVVRMNAGEPGLFRLSKAALLYGKSVGGSVTVEKVILDD